MEGERVEKPGDLAATLKRCQHAMREGRPYLVDVKIDNWDAGSDSSWYTSSPLPETNHAQADESPVRLRS